MGHTDPVYGEYGVVGAKFLIGSKDAVFLREIQVFRYVIRAEEIFHENSCCPNCCCRCLYRFIYGIDF